MADLDWKPIPKSSNIDAVAHDGEALCVRFKSGQAYRYPGEPASTVDAMLKAESAGKYFNIYVKPFREEYQKMETDSMPKPEDYAGGPLVVGNTVYIEKEVFAHAVSTCMQAALLCWDAAEGGHRTGLHPSAFRMAVEVREAIKRACGVPGIEIAVMRWQELLHDTGMKPSFPPDIADAPHRRKGDVPTAERDLAISLANRILDRPGGDPDDDLALLSRQFLRSVGLI